MARFGRFSVHATWSGLRAHLAISSLLLLGGLWGWGCDDTGSGTEGDPCEGISCPASATCVAGICRGPGDAGNNGAPTDTGTNNGTNNGTEDASNNGVNNGTEDTTPDTSEDLPPDVAECTECGRLEADPTTVNLSIGSVGQTVERRIFLLSVGEESVTITDMDVLSDSTGFQIIDTPIGQRLASGDFVEFGLQFTAPVVAATTATVRVFTDIPNVLSIPVEVSVKTGDDPCIDVSPNVLNFGSVQRGTDRTLTTTVTNCGGIALTVNQIQRGAFFGVQTPPTFQWTPTAGLPAMLAPGQTLDVDVTYTPARAGPELGFFTIINDSVDNPMARVDLRAIAEPPPIEDQDLHIQLEWDADASDVDLHFLRDGDPPFDCPLDCFYANTNPDWENDGDWTNDPFLDFDDIDGFGPENLNVQTLTPGTYRIFLHYYRDNYEDSFSVDTNATVRVYYNGVLQQEWTEFLDTQDDIWEVALIDWPSGTITTLGQMRTANFRSCR